MTIVNNLAQMLAQHFAGKIGLGAGDIVPALLKLLPSNGAELNIADLIEKFTQNKSVTDLASSLLGGGSNIAINAEQIISILSEAKLSQFADQLGVGTNEAAGGLAAVLPKLIEQNSQDGQLNADVLGGLAKNVLGGLFK
jgi:uncharacterized protein YidB (DUF937 family)